MSTVLLNFCFEKYIYIFITYLCYYVIALLFLINIFLISGLIANVVTANRYYLCKPNRWAALSPLREPADPEAKEEPETERSENCWSKELNNKKMEIRT